MNALFSGSGLFPLRLRDDIALSLCTVEVHFTLSTPAVLFPLLDAILFTANALT